MNLSLVRPSQARTTLRPTTLLKPTPLARPSEPMAQEYVNDIIRPALVDTVILSKCLAGNVTLDQIERDVKNVGIPLDGVTVRELCDDLVESELLTIEGNNLRITDEGRADVQKVLPWFAKVSQILTPATVGGTRR